MFAAQKRKCWHLSDMSAQDHQVIAMIVHRASFAWERRSMISFTLARKQKGEKLLWPWNLTFFNHDKFEYKIVECSLTGLFPNYHVNKLKVCQLNYLIKDCKFDLFLDTASPPNIMDWTSTLFTFVKREGSFIIRVPFLSDPGIPGTKSRAPICQGVSNSIQHLLQTQLMWLWLMKIPTDTPNKAIQGNVAMQVTQPGGQICKRCKWWTNASDSEPTLNSWTVILDSNDRF